MRMLAGGIGAATVSEAATLIKQRDLCPDLVLCDYNLPGPTNGVESIQALRVSLSRNLPAIVMTGDTRSKTMEMIASCGLPVLVKPYSGDELVHLMNQMCRGSDPPDGIRSAGLVEHMDERLS